MKYHFVGGPLGESYMAPEATAEYHGLDLEYTPQRGQCKFTMKHNDGSCTWWLYNIDRILHRVPRYVCVEVGFQHKEEKQKRDDDRLAEAVQECLDRYGEAFKKALMGGLKEAREQRERE